MQSKWTGLSVSLLLIFVIAVPIVASGGQSGLWMWLTPSITPEGQSIGTLFYWVLWLCGVLFVGIHAIMIYFAIAYRKGNRDSTPHTHGHLGVEVTWTIIPTLIMVFLGIYTFNVYASVIDPPEDPLEVNVIAQQFAWTFKYPEQDITLSNRLVLPSQKGIQFQIESKDVIHSFYVPSFRMKQDAVPGLTTIMNISKITKTGEYSVKCTQLCGVGHYRMNAKLYVIPSKKFDTWLAKSNSDKRSKYLKKVLKNE
jgi:cytochrome c oxidase subunit 2